ncbi:MAG: pseudouridine synthase [Calditrichia bacterium]
MELKYPVRLDRYLGNAGYGSRNELKTIIRRKRVKVNGRIVTDPAFKIHQDDRIEMDDEIIDSYRHFYLIFHKPAGYVCSNDDPMHPTIFTLIDHPLVEKLQIVGRLDKDVTGMVLLTTDGKFNHFITSPRKLHPKYYQIQLEENLTEAQIEKLKSGVEIEDGVKIIVQKVAKISDKLYELVITSGQHHVVKKIVAGVGAELIHLHRIQIGGFRLPEDLGEGEFRELTQDELEKVKDNPLIFDRA